MRFFFCAWNYMMTITFQTIGASKMCLFLSIIRQGRFYAPFIPALSKCFDMPHSPPPLCARSSSSLNA